MNTDGTAVQAFCDTVKAMECVEFERCGIKADGTFICRTVMASKSEQTKLKNELALRPALKHLVDYTYITAQDIPARHLPAQSIPARHLPAQSIPARHLLQKIENPSVKITACNDGVLQWAKSQDAVATKPYAIVNSLDHDQKMNTGVSLAVKKLMGGNNSVYYQVSAQNNIKRGECFSYDFRAGDNPAGYSNCAGLYHVLPPLAGSSDFDKILTETFISIFTAAYQNQVECVFCPLVSCGLAGGTGEALANAVSKAKTAFEATGISAPELILVGRSSNPNDKVVRKSFEEQWLKLAKNHSSVPGRKTSSSPVTGASALSSYTDARKEKRLKAQAGSHAGGRYEPQVSVYPGSAFSAEKFSNTGSQRHSHVRTQASTTGTTGGYSAATFSGHSTRFTSDQNARPTHNREGILVPPAGVNRETQLPGNVNLALIEQGVFGYINGYRNRDYCLFTTVDYGLQQDRGIAKKTVELLGEKYRQYCQNNKKVLTGAEREIISYDFKHGNNPPAELQSVQQVYTLCPPLAREPNSKEKLTDMLYKLLILHTTTAELRDLPIFSNFFGAGDEGWKGGQVAEAVSKAYKRAFEFFGMNTPGSPPKLVMVGMNTEQDVEFYEDFKTKWNELRAPLVRKLKKSGHDQESESSLVNRPSASAVQAAATSASINEVLNGCSRRTELIAGELDLVTSSEGLIGVASGLTDAGHRFDLVNAANHEMKHTAGIAQQFDQCFRRFHQATTKALKKANPAVAPGSCLSINLNNDEVHPPIDLKGCTNIHNAVAPRVRDYGHAGQPDMQTYHKVYTESVVSTILNASYAGSDLVVFCNIGTNIFGGTGADFADAFINALQDSRIRALGKRPHIIIAGLDTDKDIKVYNDFRERFRQQRSPSVAMGASKPASTSTSGSSPGSLRFSERSLSPERSYRIRTSNTDWLAGSGARPKQRSTYYRTSAPVDKTGNDLDGSAPSPAVISKPGESASTAFTVKGKVIDCGVCLESKPEKGSTQVSGTTVCAECSGSYAKRGVDLGNLDQNYTAVTYNPFKKVEHARSSVPGYPGCGMITVQLNATAPETLSGRTLDVTSKHETAYFPDNALGCELVRLFEVLHKHKLIYSIDESKTLAVAGNSPLLRSDYRNRSFVITGKGAHFYDCNNKKIYFKDAGDIAQYGMQMSYGVTFNVHFKTALTGAHGYKKDNGEIDYDYMGRVMGEIEEVARTNNLQSELSTDRMMQILSTA